MIIPEHILTWSIAGQMVFVALLGALILGYAGWKRYREQRMNAIRKRLRSELLERLFSSDPGWASWVQTLNRAERSALESLLDEHLRRIKGSDFERLQELAVELGVPDRAREEIGNQSKQYRALTWLALLHEPVEPDRLVEVCEGDPELRATGAKILFNSDHPDGPTRGTRLLLQDGKQPMNAMGMDTLYRLNNGTDTPLMRFLRDDHDHWDESLLVQVLLVLAHCDVTGSLDRLGWFPDLLEHDSSRVRLATIDLLRRHGWRDEIREQMDFARLTDDPDIRVREHVHVLLANWGDRDSLHWLHHAAGNADSADRLSLVEALHLHPEGSLSNMPGTFDPFVDWVRAERSVQTARRIWENASAWI